MCAIMAFREGEVKGLKIQNKKIFKGGWCSSVCRLWVQYQKELAFGTEPRQIQRYHLLIKRPSLYKTEVATFVFSGTSSIKWCLQGACWYILAYVFIQPLPLLSSVGTGAGITVYQISLIPCSRHLERPQFSTFKVRHGLSLAQANEIRTEGGTHVTLEPWQVICHVHFPLPRECESA